MAKGTLKQSLKVVKARKRKTRGPSARAIVFKKVFLDPKSETYLDVAKSARRARYSNYYARKMVEKNPTWLIVTKMKITSEDLVSKAEDHFNEVLSIPSKQQMIGAFGPLWQDKKKTVPLLGYHVGIIKQKTEVSEFVAEMLSKKYRPSKDERELPPLQTLIVINVPNNGEANRVHTVGEAVASTPALGRQDDK